MKKIVFLTNTLEYGGATKILVQIANYMSSEYEVIILNYGNQEIFYPIDPKVKVRFAKKTKCNIRKIRLITQMLLIRKEIKKIKPTAILAFGNTEKLMALGSTIGSKIKYIISERQDPFSYSVNKKHTMWLRYILADGCIFQTEGAMKYFPKSVQKKSIVIPNFIQMSPQSFVSSCKKENIISFSARFELKQKRQDVMVEAFEKFVKKFPDYKLIFYGDGLDQKYVEKIVKRKSLTDKVIFAGKTSNVLEKIKESKIFVLTSDYEGIPNVLMEAMALGIPCISTDCSPGGARLLIDNNKNGILTPIANPEKISDALEKMASDSQFADKCALEAMNILEKYSPEKILPVWKKYISDIIKGY